MNHLPRNGQYELFTFQSKTYCFDDPFFDGPAVSNPPEEMWDWLRSFPDQCRPLDDTNVAYYLTPKLYLMWKLKWT